MVLNVSHIKKEYGVDVILEDVTFHIEDGEKTAIAGINGAGKSTLLKIIMGEEPATSGEITISKDKTIGYLAQYQEISMDTTIFDAVLSSKADFISREKELSSMEMKMSELTGSDLDELMERYHVKRDAFEADGGYYYRSEVTGVLKGLGFEEGAFDRKLSELSGGQKTRVSLAKLLITKPDILMLDEPTNHLDINSIEWLESYLKAYKGAVILVSHDRYFLDKVVTKVVEIYNHKAIMYSGNYTAFSQKKTEVILAMMKAYLNQQREIAHQQAVIDKLKQFNREKSIKRAESRQKALDKIEVLEKPVEVDSEMRITLTPNITSGEDVLSVKGLAKSFGELQLFKDIDIDIKRGERVALIGPNGCGKTTMLKILTGNLSADAGDFRLGTNVHIGYYDQEQQQFDEKNSLFEEIQSEHADMNNTAVRSTLAAFLFTGDDVFKLIGDLSGGERGRLALAKLMLSEANFLILDEPTNHLDSDSKEILEDALNSYEGTVFFVSHDRYFINRTATRILEFAEYGLTNYIGNYDYYLEKKASIKVDATGNVSYNVSANKIAPATQAEGQAVSSKEAAKLDYARQKQEAALAKKKERELAACEEEIDKLETKKAALEEEMSDPAVASVSAKLNEISNALAEIDAKLADLYDKWETLSS